MTSTSTSESAPSPPSPRFRVGVLVDLRCPSLRHVARRNCIAVRHERSGCELAAVAFAGGGNDKDCDNESRARDRELIRKFCGEVLADEGGGDEGDDDDNGGERKQSKAVRVFEGRRAYEELIEKGDVDAVYLPLLTRHHKEWALRSIAAGRHVLVEHPAAPRAPDYAEMLSFASARGKLLEEGAAFLRRRRTDEFLRAIRDERRVGAVDRVHCVLTCPERDYRGGRRGDGRRGHRCRNGRTLFRRGSSNDAWYYFSDGDDDYDDEALTCSTYDDSVEKEGGVEEDPMGCIGTLGWYCVCMAVVVFSALGSGRAVQARVVRVRRRLREDGDDALRWDSSGGVGAPVDAECLVVFEHGRTLSFRCAYRRGLRQRVEAHGSAMSASVTDFVWPRRRRRSSFLEGAGGCFSPRGNDFEEEEEEEAVRVAHRYGKDGTGVGCVATAKDKDVPQDWHVAAENVGGGRGRGCEAASAEEGATTTSAAPCEDGRLEVAQEAMMWRIFAMAARRMDKATERGKRAAREAALAEAKGLREPVISSSEHGEFDLEDDTVNSGDNSVLNGTAKDGWVGKDGILEKSERMTDLSLRTQEVMDALMESLQNGCKVVEIL